MKGLTPCRRQTPEVTPPFCSIPRLGLEICSHLLTWKGVSGLGSFASTVLCGNAQKHFQRPRWARSFGTARPFRKDRGHRRTGSLRSRTAEMQGISEVLQFTVVKERSGMSSL